MRFRQLGPTALKISEIALGTIVFGWRTPASSAFKIIDRAIDAGVNLIDTSNSYGRGHSEEIIGNALARNGHRDKIILSTKFHLVPRPDENTPIGSLGRYIKLQCEDSLQRLRTDRIDLYHFHGPYAGVLGPEIVEALSDLVRTGKVAHLATSNFAAWQLAEVAELNLGDRLAGFIAEQAPSNLLDRSIEREVLPFAAAHGLGVVAWSPLAEGILSGKYRRGAALPSESRYAKVDKPGFHRARLTDAVFDLIVGLERLAQARGTTLSALSLAWLIQQPGVTSAIAGPRTLEQLEDNLKVLKSFQPKLNVVQ